MRRGAIALTMLAVFKPLIAEVTRKRAWLQNDNDTVSHNSLTRKAEAPAQQSNEPRSRSANLCRIPKTAQEEGCTGESCPSLQEEQPGCSGDLNA